jgi:EAL domain-containing protein (putative c-di-GMP-specific phosphodiesterase class I)
VEALIRWRHPVHGLLGPGAFLPQVEQDAALMASMTLYVLDYVAWQWKDWNAKGLKPVVSVNLSALSVSAPGFADRLLEKLDQLGLPPSHLVFELTESASVSNLGHTLANLIRLKMRGYNLSIDDFGTGFATFEQLERIPFGELKIDQSITRELAASARHAALAQNLIRMAGDLGLITVAEGIETQAAWDALKAMGCNRGQGYFLGRPMPGDQLGEWALADRTHLR